MKSPGLVLIATFLIAGALCLQEKIDDGIGELSVSLMKKLMKKDGKNIVLSAFSLSEALGMCLQGARKETFSQMSTALGLGSLSRSEILSAYQGLSQLPGVKTAGTSPNQFKIVKGNRLYIQDSLALNETYQSEVQSHFDALVKSADFAKKGGAVKTEINKFVADSTNNLIKELLKEPLSPDTVLAVINTLYFRGTWDKKFYRINLEEKFNENACNGFSSSTATWMSAETYLGYKESSVLKAIIIDIPYVTKEKVDDTVSMVILHPKEDQRCNFDGWLSQLKWSSIAAEIGASFKTDMNLKMPSFKAESKFEMSETLGALGMPSAFTDAADFTGMLKSASKLKISQVIHQAKIDTNINGTEAAASTGLNLVPLSARFNAKKIKINSSFLSIIVLKRANGSRVPLFVTVVKDATY